MAKENPRTLKHQRIKIENVFDNNGVEEVEDAPSIEPSHHDTPSILISNHGKIALVPMFDVFALDTITEENVVDAVQKLVTLLKQ